MDVACDVPNTSEPLRNGIYLDEINGNILPERIDRE
jgi:hypothetical protein